jgi:hypothetical protein
MIGQMTQEELETHLSQIFAGAIQSGQHLVINYEKASNFDAKKFFSNLKFISSEFWQMKNLLEVKFLRKIGIVNKSNDKDVFGNAGFYTSNESFAISFLCTCSEEEFNDVTLNIPEVANFEFIHIK